MSVPSLASVPSKSAVVDLCSAWFCCPHGQRVILPKGENPGELRLDIYYENTLFTLLVMSYFETIEGLSSVGGMKALPRRRWLQTNRLKQPFRILRTIRSLNGPSRINFVIRALRPYHGASERGTAGRIAGRPDIKPLIWNSYGVVVPRAHRPGIALEVDERNRNPTFR